jgi:hypothetical protein
MDSAGELFSTLERKYNNASGPWKLGIGFLIFLVAIATIAYYIYKWLVAVMNQDERALRKSFGVIQMKYNDPKRHNRSIARSYRKSLIGSDPSVLEALGTAKEFGPGPHFKFFGLHSYIVINVRPRNFQYSVYVQRDDRYNAFTAKLTVVISIQNLLRWFMANYEPEQVINAIIEDGLRQVRGHHGFELFDVKADSNELQERLWFRVQSDLVKLGVKIDNVFISMPEERTDTMMPEVIRDKGFMAEIIAYLREQATSKKSDDVNISTTTI